MHQEHSAMVASESSTREYFKFVIVILLIALTSFFLNGKYGASSLFGFFRLFMGVFFLVFASFKFIGYKMFAMMFAGYDIIAKKFKAYAFAYPFIELALAVLYLGNIAPNIRDVATIVIMGIASIGVIQEIQKRSGMHCACLGNIIKLPLSTVSLFEDVGMGLMALATMILR